MQPIHARQNLIHLSKHNSRCKNFLVRKCKKEKNEVMYFLYQSGVFEAKDIIILIIYT